MIDVRKVQKENLEEVWRLVHDSYVDSGYIEKQPNGLLKHYPHLEFLDETVTFGAFINRQLVGTCTITFDSKALLPVDIDYPYEVGIIRKINVTKLATCWRLATTPECRYKTSVVIALMKKIMVNFIVHKQPLLLCEINPKHYNFYHKIWGFVEIARKDWTSGLNNAPSILISARPKDYANRYLE